MDYFEETDRARNRGLAAYSSASFGYSFSAMTVSIFLMYYYTDVLELSALSVTVILFVARFFDGAVDPFIGHYMDGHTTKYGKYRGYLLYWAGPSCVFFVILFVPSPLPGYGALLWYMSAYLLWSFSASMLEVSYLPLMASISCGGDRNLTNTLKISASIVAVVATSFLTLKLVKAFGGGSA
ncbi:MAG: MFS transporter, partial [Synergistaceae bacterium]|nr:MFS transporter [Synergistaceae bacterium]